ncbi:sugar porter family MFS transporter [Gilvimarinus chinensis]|uniref:sugar porter family MFS transporter n=1 Tax=Gilvimarinus chinensis TaxID=396005 RepID=UPI0003806B62|nr:sugar porter family MFS transporter [Gilvimarinus chinensis]
MHSYDNKVTKFSLIAAFGGFVFGLDAANISGAVRFVSAQFQLDALEQGLVVSCALLGVIVALFFTGSLVERFGRKSVLLGIAFAYTLSSLISSLAMNYPMLVAGRFIGGVAFASLTVSAMYIGEMAPPKTRGRFVSINQLLITLGSLVAFVVNYFLVKSMAGIEWLNESNIWRFMLGAELIVNVVWIALLVTIPESPRWLAKKRRDDDARKVLLMTLPAEQVDNTMLEIQHSIHQEGDVPVLKQLRQLFSGPMRFVLLVAVAYAVVQGGSGMNAVLFYAPTVFEQIGATVESSFMQTILLGAVAVIFTLVAIFSVEKFGRRNLTLVGLTIIVLAHCSIWYGFNNASYSIDEQSLTVIAEQGVEVESLGSLIGTTYANDVELKAVLAERFDKSELPLISGAVINASIDIDATFVLLGLFAFLAAFNMSIGPIMWVVFSEIFSNDVRSVALPFAALVQTLASFSIQQIFPWQLEVMGAASTFLNYAFVALAGLVVMGIFLPETKGKSIEEIEQDLVKAS